MLNGVAATLGHAFIVWAAVNAPTNLLAPFQYVEIIGASLLGYLVFGDVPAPSTIAGVGIIVASGLYLFHRERQRPLGATGQPGRLVKPDNRPGNACHIGGGKGQVSDPGLHENAGYQYRTPSQYRQNGHGGKFQSLTSKCWDGGNGKPANNDKPCADICRLSRPSNAKLEINADQIAQGTPPPARERQ